MPDTRIGKSNVGRQIGLSQMLHQDSGQAGASSAERAAPYRGSEDAQDTSKRSQTTTFQLPEPSLYGFLGDPQCAEIPLMQLVNEKAGLAANMCVQDLGFGQYL